MESAFAKVRDLYTRVAAHTGANPLRHANTTLKEVISVDWGLPLDGVDTNGTFIVRFFMRKRPRASARPLSNPRPPRSTPLENPQQASLLLHTAGSPFEPFVPGFLAAPQVSALLLLPGLTPLHLVSLKALRPAGDGVSGHFLLRNPGSYRDEDDFSVSLGQWGAVGVMAVGLHFMDLAAPPAAPYAAPPGVLAALAGSSLAVTADFAPLEPLIKPFTLAGPSLLALLDALLGTVLEYDNSPYSLAAQAAAAGLSRATLSSLFLLYTKALEMALTVVGDLRSLTLGLSVKGAAGVHAAAHVALKKGSLTAKFASSFAAPSAPSSLWPDVPSTPSLMLASGNSLSSAAVAAIEASFFGPALAQLRNASASSPTAALLRDALVFLSAWNGPSDGVQLSLLDNGAGDREHPNCPPGLPDGKVLLAPGVVALFAKGNRAEDVWVRHDALESALRTAAGPGLPWSRPLEAQALTAGGEARSSSSRARGVDCETCTNGPYKFCAGTGECLPPSTTSGCPGKFIWYATDCPRAALQAAVAAPYEPALTVVASNATRSIGGVVFLQRRIVVTSALPGAPALVVDTNVGTVAGRVLAFSVASDAAVLPFVVAAAGGAAAKDVPRFEASKGVPDAMARFAKSKSDVFAVRPGPALTYFCKLALLAEGESPPLCRNDQTERIAEALAEAGVVVAGASSSEAGGHGSSWELFTDAEVSWGARAAFYFCWSLPRFFHRKRPLTPFLTHPPPTHTHSRFLYPAACFFRVEKFRGEGETEFAGKAGAGRERAVVGKG